MPTRKLHAGEGRRTSGDAAGQREYIRIGRSASGIERLEAHLRGRAFSPHRHDTYAIGFTLSGVQTFRYRGAQRYCRPNQCHVLHPDETHDGAAATDAGFGYRIAYLAPSLVQEALGGRSLPFVGDPIVDLTPIQWTRLARLWEMDDEIDEVGRVELMVAVADTLEMLSTKKGEGVPRLSLSAVARVRDFLAATPARQSSARELELVAGLDRWTLARQFRVAFGTSPSRFRTMRQLDLVRRLLRSGSSCAEAALEAGFSDQSHMTRMFKRAYGLTPAGWASMSNDGSSSRPSGDRREAPDRQRSGRSCSSTSPLEE